MKLPLRICAAIIGAALTQTMFTLPAYADYQDRRQPRQRTQSGPDDGFEPVKHLWWYLRDSNAARSGAEESLVGDGRHDALACRPGHSYQSRPGLFDSGRFSLKDAVRDGGDRYDRMEFQFGRASDSLPMCGDWDGDGVETPVIRRGNTFHFADQNRSGTRAQTQTFGRANDFFLVGDWDGDGKDTIAVVRGRTWHLSNVPVGKGQARAAISFDFGYSTDYPVAGDWDGNGNDRPGFVRGRTWHLGDDWLPARQTTQISFGRGESEWAFVVGDWDGDGVDTPGVVRAKE